MVLFERAAQWGEEKKRPQHGVINIWRSRWSDDGGQKSLKEKSKTFSFLVYLIVYSKKEKDLFISYTHAYWINNVVMVDMDGTNTLDILEHETVTYSNRSPHFYNLST